jgi:hypothetical protein
MLEIAMHRRHTTKIQTIWRKRLIVAALFLVSMLPRLVAADWSLSAGPLSPDYAAANADVAPSQASIGDIADFRPVICHIGADSTPGPDQSHQSGHDCCSAACCYAFPLGDAAPSLPVAVLVAIARIAGPRGERVPTGPSQYGFRARGPPIPIAA